MRNILLIGIYSRFYGYWDFPYYDGAMYFKWARELALHGNLPPIEWSPLYVASYSVFHFFGLETYDTYFANKLFSMSLALSLFFLLLSRYMRQSIAFGLVLLFATSSAFVFDGMHIVHYWMMTSVLALCLCRTPLQLCVVASFLPFLRVEFALLSVVALIYAIYRGQYTVIWQLTVIICC